jgi:hypothetical protein
MIRFLFCLLLITSGCGNKKNNPRTVYFAGEIVNPTSDYVVLFKDDIRIDSARLDENNRFTFQLDGIKEGLHNFKHAPEYQYVYLEEGDSLVIRLNTSYFDESLVFAGTGQVVNNFLLEMFLAGEEEESLISSYYRLNPAGFSQKIDSLRQNKISLLQEVSSGSKLSQYAREVARASIDYNYYIYKELYPFYHKKIMGMKAVPELTSDFYEYRASLDLNNKQLTYFRPYYKYINYHLGNLTYMQCMENCETHDQTIDSYLHSNMHKLGLIDSLITEKQLRDIVFRHVAMDYLLRVQDNEDNNRKFIETFHKLSGNNRHLNEIDDLYKAVMNIQPNKALPNIVLQSTEGNKITLREIAKDKNVVFYFWSATQRGHFDNIVQRIKQLSEKDENYSFVGINFNTDETLWKGLIESKGLDKSNQYRAENFEELTNSLIVYPMNKAIIVKDSLIVNAFANLYTSF